MADDPLKAALLERAKRERAKRQAAAPAVEQPQERGLLRALGDNVIGFDDGVDSFGERLGRGINDAIPAAGAGLARGAASFADLPSDVIGMGAGLGSAVAEGMGWASPEEAEAAQAYIASMGPALTGQDQSARDQLAMATGGATEFRGDTTAGQYAGTAAEFVPGALAAPGGLLSNALRYGVVPGLASEGAGQLTEGTAAEPVARAVAPIATGLLGGLATRPARPKAPTREALRGQADDLYQAGDARAAAPAADVDALAAQIDSELTNLNIKTPTGRIVADGNVKKFLDVLEDYKGQPMTPEQMQTARRLLTDAAGSTDASDRRIGAALLSKFDEWRNSRVPEYSQADQLYGRAKRAEDVDFRIEKAERRAASSGTGGNSVNTARQNIRAILDNPKARRGYSAEEIEAMEAIVRGTPAVNLMRTVGRLSPTSGALPLMGNLMATGAYGASGNPLLAVPGIAGFLAKGGSEVLTNRQIGLLSELIRNGGPLAARGSSGIGEGILAALAGANAGRE